MHVGNLLIVVNTHTHQHGVPHYCAAFMCLCEPVGLHQTKRSALTWFDTSALNSGQISLSWIHRWTLSSRPSIYASFLPVSLQYVAAPLSLLLSPSGRLWSPAAVWASKVFKRFAISPSSPTDPFIFFKKDGAKANCGFQDICSVLLYPLPRPSLLAKHLDRDALTV